MKFCLSQDFYKLNNKLYRQTEVGMGYPLFPLFSDILLDNLERKCILNKFEVMAELILN